MSLTKLINGIRVQIPTDEESLKRDEWAKSDREKEIEIQKDYEKKDRKLALELTAKTKLMSLGFENDEIEVLINKN